MHPFLGVYGSSYKTVQRTTTVPTVGGGYTTPGTAHTWGTPTQLVASTPADTVGICYKVNTSTSASGARADTLVELMIGGSGSETSLVGPIACAGRNGGVVYTLPLFIPAGSRISVRFKSNRVSTAFNSWIDLAHGPNRDGVGLPQRWVSYGLVNDASNSRGTIITPGSSNAWGSWTSLTASTTYAHDLWVPIVDRGTSSSTTTTTYRTQWAVASTTDAATMATNGTVWDGPMWANTTAEIMNDPVTFTNSSPIIGVPFTPNGIIYSPRASGAAVSARAMCSGTPDSNATACSVLAAI
jgi:hypothetical protein